MLKIPHNEKKLLFRLSAGDPGAFRTVFETYWDHVYGAALALVKSPAVAEDIAQDIFTQLWERRANLPGIQNFKAYLYTLAKNRILDRFRHLSTQQQYRKHIYNYMNECDTERVDELAEARDIQRILENAIQSLPPQQQRAFKLSRFNGLNHDEIAQAMGVSKVTIKSYIVQAISTLRKVLAKQPVPFWLPLFLLQKFL
ncbi:RNA polymerase sigma factor [Chitinophaga caeni]|nr:RNA polymerase sigma-70 factor [Chitinophaga caeni]